MDKNTKNDCRCDETTCGCETVAAEPCKCGNVCTCTRRCGCGEGCGCATRDRE